ncbi:hypothetical protein CEXT_348501 [Caerostris extrusa]|uniref:Uncharacterized protein n=1 Tax=Caerostris extrusa TaxID=172846 RepID=A0AAV4TW56_CAEEX|nr:hypothetical protein CEXT_348501 [Caerostris extrusa]
MNAASITKSSSSPHHHLLFVRKKREMKAIKSHKINACHLLARDQSDMRKRPLRAKSPRRVSLSSVSFHPSARKLTYLTPIRKIDSPEFPRSQNGGGGKSKKRKKEKTFV